MAGGFVITRIADRLGRGRTLRLGTGLIAFAALAFALAPHFSLGFVALFAGGFGGTVIIVNVNAFLLQRQRAAADAALAEMNTLVALACLLGPLTVGFGAAAVLGGWRGGPLLLVAACIAVEIWRGRNLSAYAATPTTTAARAGRRPSTAGSEAPSSTVALDPPADDAHAAQQHTLPRLYWWAMSTLVLLVGVEFALSLWGAELLRERGGLQAAAAAISLVCLVGGMATGRAIGARLLESLPPEPVFLASIALAFGGFAVAWITTSAPVMIAALALTGMGVGLHWPIGISRALRASGGRPERAGAYVSIGVSLASGAAPLALGLLSDAFGLHAAFLIVPVLLVLAFAFAATHRVARVVALS